MKPLTWEEHEKLYCKNCDISKRDIYTITDSYPDARKIKDNYEMGYEEGNIGCLEIIKYNNKYYLIYKI